jgi:Sulfotransferase domain
MALEIIGAGFGRTGTYSLKAALERLGFGPCHHMSEVINDPEQVTLWAEVAGGRPDFERIFAGFRSAVDFPVSAYWQDVLAATPGAKVILSDRDPEDWYGSFSQTILPLILDKAAWPDNRRPWFEMIDKVIVGKALGGRTDREGILAAYRANAKAAQALEAEGRALLFRSRDGWAPLCDFLGVEVPDEPYPKTNPRAEFFAAVKSGAEVPAD